jgi:hypothetical protein
MKRIGFEKARARLRDAFQAHEDLKASIDWVAFESAWTRLLTALHSVYSILEQSAKGHPKSYAWFGAQRRVRRTDEALSYLHHARNANEHGIKEVLETRPGGIGIGHPSGSAYIKELRVGPQGIEKLVGWGPDGSPLEVRSYPSRIELVSVFESGVRFDPPSTFLGDQLVVATPIGLSSKVLEHMTYLFADAENLLVST